MGSLFLSALRKVHKLATSRRTLSNYGFEEPAAFLPPTLRETPQTLENADYF